MSKRTFRCDALGSGVIEKAGAACCSGFSFFLQLLAELQKQRNLSGEPFVARLRCMGHLVNRFGLPADLFHGVADREQVDEECEDGESRLRSAPRR